MNKNFIFFLVATIILLLSIVVLYVAPIVHGYGDEWKTLNCLILSDNIEKSEENIKDLPSNTDEKEKKDREKVLKRDKKRRDLCYRMKAMYGLEYSAFTINVVVGFICALLGFIHYLDEGKSFMPKTGLIGLFSGVIGFAITVVYFIYNILVYTSPSGEKKVDENMAFAKYDSSKKVYLCNFYDEDDLDSIYAKYSELGKKQYNYIKDLYIAHEYDEDSEIHGCRKNDDLISYCNSNNNITGPFMYPSKGSQKECTQLYKIPEEKNVNMDINNRWLTTIILSAITIICNLCLALFGFLLFKNKEESGEVKVV